MEILKTQSFEATTTTKATTASKGAAPAQQEPAAENRKTQQAEPVARPLEESKERLEAATNQINESLSMSQRSVRLDVHEGSGRPVIQVVDVETSEVIRQLPSERVLKLANWRSENGLVGAPLDVSVLLDETA